jgi:hypothetical protein
MANARNIASLYARRRRLILGLRDFERRAEVYRSTIAHLEARLQTLVPIVPAFKPRRCCPYFSSRELSRGCQDALREANGKALTTNEVVIFLMRRKGLDVDDIILREAIRRRVRATLRRMSVRNDARLSPGSLPVATKIH